VSAVLNAVYELNNLRPFIAGVDEHRHYTGIYLLAPIQQNGAVLAAGKTYIDFIKPPLSLCECAYNFEAVENLLFKRPRLFGVKFLQIHVIVFDYCVL